MNVRHVRKLPKILKCGFAANINFQKGATRTFPRPFSTSAGNESNSWKDAILLGSILGSASAILLAGLTVTYHLDTKIGNFRSEILSAISNAQCERIRALEVMAAERKKYW